MGTFNTDEQPKHASLVIDQETFETFFQSCRDLYKQLLEKDKAKDRGDDVVLTAEEINFANHFHAYAEKLNIKLKEQIDKGLMVPKKKD